MFEEEKVKKLDRLLSLLDPENALSKKDFTDAFAKVLDLVQSLLKKHSDAIASLQEQHQQMLKEMSDEHTTNYRTLKEQTNELFVGDQLKRMDSETKAEFKKLQVSFNQLTDSKLKELEHKVAQLKPIKGDKGDMGEMGPMPTEHLQLMKDMIAKMKQIENILSNLPRGKGMGRFKVPKYSIVDLTTSFDGTSTTATVPRDTVQVLMVWSTQFPQVLRPNVDFTLAGQTLTLVTREIGTIESGQTVVALIETLFYGS